MIVTMHSSSKLEEIITDDGQTAKHTNSSVDKETAYIANP